jgi:hypothetical protein
MARKKQKLLRIDESILNEFEKICKKKKSEYSYEVEQMMKDYIARDGQKLVDELYAEQIGKAVKSAMDDQVNRLAKMIYNVNVDTTAVLNSVPAIYKKNLKAIETTFENFMNEQLLSPERSSQADHFDYNSDGQKMVSNLRNHARNDIQQRKLAKQNDFS